MISVTALGIALLSRPAQAADAPTLADIARRLDQLEQSNADLAKQNAELRAEVQTLSAETHAQADPRTRILTTTSANGAPAAVAPAPLIEQHGTTWRTPGGQVALYGNIDVSLDDATKGLDGKHAPDGSAPVGKMGWQPDLSSNISYVGVRGFQKLTDDLNFVYQFETQIEVTDQAGVGDSTSAQSNVVKGALTSRNTFIGLASPKLGRDQVRQDRCAL